MRKLLALTIVTTVILAGCTDRNIGKIRSYGGSATIKCYSGEMLIYEGQSTGKIQSEANSDGYSFVDTKTKKLKEVSGNCDITYVEY